MMNHRKQLPLINPYDVRNNDTPAARDEPAHVQLSAASTHRRSDPAFPRALPEQDDGLVLPNDALVALRKSGGLMFSSREIVVHRDGRITRRGQGGGQKRFEDATQRLSDEQLAALAKLVQRTKFPRAAETAHPSPDAFVYELAVRGARTVRTAELAQGSVPAALKPLLSWLEQQLSQDS